ncbi:MAG: Fe-S-cluster-containing dehydrogenase component [Patescibacteria group bacterium]|jgi:Fe-S-cluster-containing dehydrogenase component
MKYGFVIDNRKCIGCHACTTACKSEHEVPVGVNRTWVKQVEKGVFPNTRRLFSVMRCNHCTDAPCVEICPVESLFIREDGIVDFDKDRCIGCKSCMQACPYDALYIDPETHTAAKCNYCAHRVDVGLEPACVNVCPEEAIISGDMEDPDSKIAALLSRQQVKVRKPEKGTNPNLFYIDADDLSLNPGATPKGEPYFWNSQGLGVGHFAKEAEKLAFSNGDVIQAIMEAKSESPTVDELSNNGNARSVDVVMGKGRRIYDTPDKGILWGWEVSAYVWTKAISAGAFPGLLAGQK